MIKKPEQFERRGRRRRWSTREEIRILHETKIKLQVCSSVESASISGFSLSLSLFLVIASYCLKLLWKESDGKYVEEEETWHERTQDGELIWKEKKRWMCCNWKKKWKLKSIKAISSPAAAALYVCHALRRLSFHILFSCELPLFILSSSRGRLEVIQTKELLSKWMECHLPVGYESVLQNVRPEKRRWRREETFWTKKKRGRASDTRESHKEKGMHSSSPSQMKLSVIVTSFLWIFFHWFPFSLFWSILCLLSFYRKSVREAEKRRKKEERNETIPLDKIHCESRANLFFTSFKCEEPKFLMFLASRDTKWEKRKRRDQRKDDEPRDCSLCYSDFHVRSPVHTFTDRDSRTNICCWVTVYSQTEDQRQKFKYLWRNRTKDRRLQHERQEQDQSKSNFCLSSLSKKSSLFLFFFLYQA